MLKFEDAQMNEKQTNERKSKNHLNISSEFFFHCCAKVGNIVNPNAKPPNPYQEIDDYLNSDLSYNYKGNYYEDRDIDILLYWKEKQHQFPILSNIAKQVCAIPASNTSIERLFSAAKNTVNENRTNLGSERINQLLFLQNNLTVLKQLFHESRRKRTISMSSTTTVSSEDSSCKMPKQSRIDDEDTDSTSDEIEIFFD